MNKRTITGLFKKVTAILLSVILSIPVMSFAADANAAGLCSSPEDVTRALDAMQDIYKGQFWNGGLSTSTLKKAVDEGYADPYNNIDLATRRSKLGVSGKIKYYDSSNHFNGGQCNGFAKYMFYVLFGVEVGSDAPPPSDGSYSVLYVDDNFHFQAGDFVFDKYSQTHTGLVYKAENGRVQIVEANVKNTKLSEGDPNGNQKCYCYINWHEQPYRYQNTKSLNYGDEAQLKNLIINNGGYVFRYNFGGSQAQSTSQESAESTLAINNVSEIGTINEGKTYSLTGNVTSNYNITNVTGTIYNSNGSSVYTKSVNPNSKSYTLRNSKIDGAMLFNYLSSGDYTYTVSASDSKGNYKEESRSFYIKGSNESSAPEQTKAGSTLSISGVSPIGSIREGNTYPIDGTVTSNYTITDVTGTIFDSDGNTVYTKSVNPNKQSYKLKYSAVDNAMLFNYLSAGTYTYKVSASDNGGGYQENSQEFTIEGQNSDAEAKEGAKAEEGAKAGAVAKAESAIEEREREEAKESEDTCKSSDDAQIIVLPDHENEEMSISGDTGRFDLHLGSSSSTTSFTAASDKLTIVTRGQVEDLLNGSIRTDASRHFTMYLYDVTDGHESYVSGYYANCDNIEGGIEFDVEEGHQYKIRLETSGLSYNEAVTGDGHAYPIR